jgi:hypothetical protein
VVRGSHATARTAHDGAATPDHDHLLDIGGSRILQFRAWYRATQRAGRGAQRHRCKRHTNRGNKTSHDRLFFN